MNHLHFVNRWGNELYRTPTHLYIKPHPLLRPYIAHYTVCTPSPSPSPSETLTLIPDASGCLVFRLESGRLSAHVFGATSRIVVVRNDLDVCPLRFFVEFLPGGLLRFVAENQAGLADHVLPLGQVNRALERLVEEQFDAAADLDEFVRQVDRALLRQPPPGWPHPAVEYLLSRLRGSLGSEPLGELAAGTGYSERYLGRVFREAVGVKPKTFARLVRVNTAIPRILKGGTGMAALSQELGFYDQAHFIHDFKVVCGATPTAYLEGMSGFYNEILKF